MPERETTDLCRVVSCSEVAYRRRSLICIAACTSAVSRMNDGGDGGAVISDGVGEEQRCLLHAWIIVTWLTRASCAANDTSLLELGDETPNKLVNEVPATHTHQTSPEC